jgi:hypothetical protein
MPPASPLFLSRLGERRYAILFAGFLSLLVIAFGVVLTFIVAPKQEREWRRIERFPQLDRNGYTATPSGGYVVVTGRLQDNSTLTRHELVAYRLDEWTVSRDEDGDDEGRWRTVEVNVPGLAISINGGVVKTAAVDSVAMSGQVHEFIERGDSRRQAPYAGRSLPDGSLRTQGFRNRDLVTAVGRTTSTGELRPERLHGGDRPHLVDHMRSNARALRVFGIVLLAFSSLPWLAIALWTVRNLYFTRASPR